MSEPLSREQLEDALAAELVSELDFDDVCSTALHYLDRVAELEKERDALAHELEGALFLLRDESELRDKDRARASHAEAGLAAAQKALKWYAWQYGSPDRLITDGGQRARDVLARGGGQQETG